MRAHGEPGFPDPQPNGNLLIDGRKDHLNGGQPVLFGGVINSGRKVFGDTWPWNGTTWSQLSPQASPA